MKIHSKLLIGLIITATNTGCKYQRIGDLTMISSRNIDTQTEYTLIQKYATGKAKSSRGDALQQAIDNAVKISPTGEFLKNVRIYTRSNGKIIKVEGDIWGIPSLEKNITITVNEKIEFKAGDKVTFKNNLGKIMEGTILGVNLTKAVVEYLDLIGNETMKEIEFEKLTKIQTR